MNIEKKINSIKSEIERLENELQELEKEILIGVENKSIAFVTWTA